MRQLATHVLVLVLFLSLAAALQAQSTTSASLTGRISDPSKAVIPDAKIIVINAGTNVRYEGMTNETGTYYVTNLPPGTYRIEVEKLGFKTVIKPDVVLHVQDALEVNFEMALGSASETITVEGGAPLLQTENATLGGVTPHDVIVSLPLANRNFTQILALSAGVSVELPDAGQLGKNNQNVSANGVRTTQNNFEFNGIDANNLSENSASGFGPQVGLAVPAPDTIAEFRVQTGMNDASSGRDAGASVNLVSRTGTNLFHGNLWEFFRNEDLNANDFFRNRNAQPRPVLKQNQFGATLGGPIRRDKTFFFLSYQGTIQRNGESSLGSSTSFLPPLTNDRSAAALGRIFGGQTGAFGGVAVAQNGSNINPAALALLNFKFPNGQYAIPTPQIILPNGIGQSSFSSPAHFSENQYTLNVDHVFSAKDILSARFFYSNAPESSLFTALGGANLPGWGQNERDRNILLVLSETHQFSPRLTNDFRIGYVRFEGARTVAEPIKASDVGITSPTGVPGLPIIMLVGQFTIGPSYEQSFFEVTNNFVWKDMVSYTVGRHNLRMGFEAKRTQINTNSPFLDRGGLMFLSFPDFLLGMSAAQNGSYFSNVFVSIADNGIFTLSERYTNLSGFVQDDIKASSRLTLNLGLRYDYFGPPASPQARLVNFIPELANPVPPSTGTLAGLAVASNFRGTVPSGVAKLTDAGLWDKDLTNFAPRLGFALRPFQKSNVVLRGGYGVYYEVSTAQIAHQSIFSPPFVLAVNSGGPQNASATFQTPLPTPLPPLSAFPIFVPWSANSSANIPATSRTMLKSPYTQQYSLGVQYEFLPNFLLDVGYVGSRSGRQPIVIGFNQALIASSTNPVHGVTTTSVSNVSQRLPFQGISPYSGISETTANSNYNSLQVKVTKRLSSGFTFLAGYTWSKSLDISSGSSVSSLALGGLIGDQTNARANYGPSNFDRTQRLVISFLYQAPNLRRGPTILQQLASRWEFSGIMLFQSGLPFSAIDSRSGSIFGGSGFAECTGVSPAKSGPVADRLNAYIDTSAFAPPPPLFDGTGFGNCGRNILRGPGQRNLDLAVHRTFPMPLREGSNLEFRAEFFNITNTPKFGLPGNDLASGQTLGVISSTVSNPRIIQFALKYNF